eukprot:504845_1
MAIKLFVAELTGVTTEIDVKLETTIQDIRLIIQDKRGIDADFQRLMFEGKSLCPMCKLMDYNIPNESKLHLLLNIGCVNGFPVTTLLNNIYFESMNYYDLHRILSINIGWDFHLTKLIFGYSSFIEFSCMKINIKTCMALNGGVQRSFDESQNFCKGCKRYTYHKKQINVEKIFKNIQREHIAISNDIKFNGFYGLFVKLEFSPIQKRLYIDVNLINKQNIRQYIEIKENTNNIPIIFDLYNIQQTSNNKQMVTIFIKPETLKNKQVS